MHLQLSDLPEQDRELAMLHVASNEPRIPPIREYRYTEWLRQMFPSTFTYPFAQHQQEHWSHTWKIRRGIRPKPLIDCWSRGHGKSSNAEITPIALGALDRRSYCLYVGSVETQAAKHLAAIETKLGGKAIQEYYPKLGTRKTSTYHHSKGWNRYRLATDGGLTIDAVALESGLRGFKEDDLRVDCLIFDEFDSLHDSALVVAKKVETITQTILPMKAEDCAIFFVQNVVHRNSIMARLLDGRADWLTDRVVTGGGAIKAILDLVYEREADSRKWVILSGTPTWAGYDLVKAQADMNDEGPTAFLRERQHEVYGAEEGALFPMWNELYSVITWSEFQAKFGRDATDREGRPCLPRYGSIARGLDVGTTIAHPTGVAWLWRPTEAMPLHDTVFAYRELVLPEYPYPETLEISATLVGEKIVELQQPWGEANAGRIRVSLSSHERPDWVNTFRRDMKPGYKLRFQQWKPNKKAGIAQWQNLMTAIDMQLPNPFRPEIKGRARFICVVADDQGGLYTDHEGAWQVRKGVDCKGMVRLRDEIPKYVLPKDAAGDEKEDPKKLFDDLVDPIKAILDEFMPGKKGMTEDEKVEAALPEKYTAEAVAARLEEDPWAEFARSNAVNLARETIRKKQRPAQTAREKLGKLDRR